MATNLDSLEAAHKKFVNHLKNKGRAQATILAYRKDIEQLVEFLKAKEISQTTSINSQHIEEFKKDLLDKKFINKKPYSEKKLIEFSDLAKKYVEICDVR